MTKTHKHRTKVAEIHYFKPVRDSRNYESSNPAITGKIRGVVYEPEVLVIHVPKEVVEKLRK